MSVARYGTMVTLATVASLALAWAVLRARLDPAAWSAVAFGAALSAANSLAGFSLAAWAQGRDSRTFVKVELGGMLGRMAVMLGAVVLAIVGLHLPQVPLVFSLLYFFTLFQVFKLSVLNRMTGTPAGSR